MRAYNDKIKFIVGFCIWAFVLVVLTATFVVVEVYANGDRLLADIEIANGIPSGDISVVLATTK